MITKVISLINLFRKGHAVANPKAWKAGQVSVNVLSGALLATLGVASAFGLNIPLTEGHVQEIATGILAVVGIFNPAVAVVTNDKVGLPAKK